MKHERFEIETPDGIALRVESWTPQEVRCVVVVSHGAGEHIGRYARLAEALESIGALVLGPDHRGQGESGGKPGHIESFDQYGQDLMHVMNTFAQDHRAFSMTAVPWFIFGHSMGGLITLNAAVAGKLPEELRGMVISSPLLRLAMQPPALKVFLGNVAAWLAPGVTLPSGLEPADVSRDEEEVARYAEDTRRVDVVSARWFQKMKEASARVLQSMADVRTPLLWIVGTGDKICDHTASLEAFSALSAPEDDDQSLQSFEGYYHELHNEPAALRAPVFDTIRTWIAARSD